MSTSRNRNISQDFNDLYEGYEDASLSGTNKELLEDDGLQRTIQSSYGERKPSRGWRPSSRTGIQTAKAGMRPPVTGKLSTGNKSDNFRPSSSIRGVGYTAKSGRSGSGSSGVASPNTGRLSSATPIMVPPLQPQPGEDDQQHFRAAMLQFKRIEKEVRRILRDSVALLASNQLQPALEKVKEAEKLRRSLREVGEWNVKDRSALLAPLFFKISWYHAEILAMNHKFNEALKMYTDLYKSANKEEQLLIVLRIAVIHRRRGEHEPSLRLLHKLLDDLPEESTPQKMNIFEHVAACYALIGRWETAYKYNQMILQDSDSPRAAFNSLLCLVSIKSDQRKIEDAFIRLLAVKISATPQELASFAREEQEASSSNLELNGRADPLGQWQQQEKKAFENYVRNAAALVAAGHSDLTAGYDWCISQVASTIWSSWCVSLEMAKAATFLPQAQYTKAIEILTAHDNDEDDRDLRSQSCGLLCFLYFNLADFENAQKFARTAYQANKLSLKACINMGCMEYRDENYEAALSYFQEALVLNSSDFCASYYAGLALKAMGNLPVSLDVFSKLNSLHRNRANVLFQTAHIYELLEELMEAFNWLQQVYTLHPQEPFILHQLGRLADKLGDKGAALWYYNESHRLYPSNFEVLDWLGRFFVASQFPEKAIKYFDLASQLSSDTPKWALMAGGAMRRAGHLTDAYNKYLAVHQQFPEDTDCLKILIRLCRETRAPASELEHYQKELDLLQVNSRPAEQITTGRPQTTRLPNGKPTNSSPGSYFSSATQPAPLAERNAIMSATGKGGLPRRNGNSQVALDAEDVEAFNVKRPGTGGRRMSRGVSLLPATHTKDEHDELNVEDILPGMVPQRSH